MSNNMEIIGEWIQNETAFKGRTDELFITTFLEFCDNDVEKTKRRIERYYELRSLYPGLMRNRDCLDEKHAKLIRQKVMYTDMNENYELPAVLAVKASRLENDDKIFDSFHALIIAIESALLHSSRLRKHGGIAIFDYANVKFTHALQFTPKLLMQTLECIFEGLPMKCKALLFINTGSILSAVISVGSLFLPKEIRSIITINSCSWETIKDKVPPQCLPIEYGGTNGTLEDNIKPIEAIFRRWRDYLLDDERYGFDDTEDKS